MSTNFYFRPTDHAQYRDEDHIGLSAGGVFLFRTYPQDGLTSFAAWQAKLQQPGLVIVDEYQRPVPFADFKALVDSCLDAPSAEYRNAPQLEAGARNGPTVQRYRDEVGYLFANYEFS